MLKDDLEIFVITYNRKAYLEKTLSSLASAECPIHDFEIKVLDNASDDGTKEFCESFISEHPNFKYIRNHRNLGISGNIIKAMEMASKKWLWTLCDDDEFDWNTWNEIEEALEKDYDIVHTTYNAGLRNETYPYLINEESFIPNPIYNTKHINNTTMQNAYALAYTLLPHHAIGCKVLNENGKIFVPKSRLVIQNNVIIENKNWFRVDKKDLFHRLNNYHLLSGYIQSYGLIQDKNLKEKCCDVMCMGTDFSNSMRWFLNNNPNGDLFNIFDILLNISDKQKKELIYQILTTDDENRKNFKTFIKNIRREQKRAQIKLFFLNLLKNIVHIFYTTPINTTKKIKRVLFIKQF